VVAVVLNLAAWFAIHTVFDRVREILLFGGLVPVPVWGSVDWFAGLLAAVTFVGLCRYHWNVIPVVVASAIVGLIHGAVVLSPRIAVPPLLAGRRCEWFFEEQMLQGENPMWLEETLRCPMHGGVT
jgi:hypothetical protein